MNPTFSCLQKSKKVFTNASSRQLMWVKKFFKKKKETTALGEPSCPKVRGRTRHMRVTHALCWSWVSTKSHIVATSFKFSVQV